MAKITLIDDDDSLREVLAFALSAEGHDVEAHADGSSALRAFEERRPDVVITDLKMPGIDGMQVLRQVRERDPSVPVIILTAFGTIEDAVEAMKWGAHHYLTKPYNRDELKVAVEQALERRRLVIENRTLKDRLRAHTQRIEIVHASRAMSDVLEIVRRVAPSDATVLVTGESGTGKEVVAQALHGQSERWAGPFVAINCAAIPRDLMESELFGYAKGAFTGAVKDKPGRFQSANGGTLLLDEVGDLSPDLQTKLLRVIETRQVDVVGGQRPVPVDVRLVAATNADLEARVREGSFRRDLFYRLNVIPIDIPPLRERPDDIPALWEHFVRKYTDKTAVRSTPDLVRTLMRRRWPGNVRELANLCQRMILLRRSDVLGVEDLPPETEDPEAPGGSTQEEIPEPAPRSFLGELPADRLPLREIEKEIIVRALAKHGGNRTRTAEYLAIPRHVLLYRMEKFRIG